LKFYDEAGNRLTARSSGQTSRAAVETWAVEQLKRGLVVQNRRITFEQFAKNWWIWDRCDYIRGQILRGARISRGYADSMRTYLTQHILPYFGSKKLQKITPKMIED